MIFEFGEYGGVVFRELRNFGDGLGAILPHE